MPTTDRKLHVFLCHASQDKPIVRELYRRLLAEGWIDPWLDEEKLLPGQDWDMEIEKAVEATDAVLVCLSQDSVSKEGYVQKEIRKILDLSDQKPEEAIFLIPLRLEDCTPPRRLTKWHYVDYFPLDKKQIVYRRLLASLESRADNLNITKSSSTNSQPSRGLGEDTFSTDPGLANLNLELVTIPEGEFPMGCLDNDIGGYPFEKPQHTVFVSDFILAKTPITVAQWMVFSEQSDYTSQAEIVGGHIWKSFGILNIGWSNNKGASWQAPRGQGIETKHIFTHPVTQVTWYDAVKFCKWLNGTSVTNTLPKGWQFRLPTEAEWEKAARGVDGRMWPWGNTPPTPELCNFNGNVGGTTPVGKYASKAFSSYGCVDMAGNVYEWCLDEFYENSYKNRATNKQIKDPCDIYVGDNRVLRGGSFSDDAKQVRATRRIMMKRDFPTWNIGFRICASPLHHMWMPDE